MERSAERVWNKILSIYLSIYLQYFILMSKNASRYQYYTYCLLYLDKLMVAWKVGMYVFVGL